MHFVYLLVLIDTVSWGNFYFPSLESLFRGCRVFNYMETKGKSRLWDVRHKALIFD